MADGAYPEATVVPIDAEELASLRDDARMLSALYHSGVDNWAGYEFALEEFHAG